MVDESHPRSDEIFKKLEWLETRLMESGFAAEHDLDGEDKEMALCNHSERLAIAYAKDYEESASLCELPFSNKTDLKACW